MRQDHILLLVLVLFSQSENPRNPRKEEKAKGEEAGREEELVVTSSLLPYVSQLSNMKI